MTPTLTFTLDGTNYGNPSGWENLSLNRSFDNRVIRTTLEGDLEYGGDAYAYLNALRTISPCKSASLTCVAECAGTSITLFESKIRLQDCSFDCDRCRVSFSVTTSSGWDEIEAGLSEKVCVSADTTLSLFQVQSGGDLGEGEFVRVYDLIEEIMNSHAGSVSLSSGILNDTPYQAHEIEVLFPAVVEDDVLEITIETTLGSTYVASATMPASVTALQAAQLLRNALLYTEVNGAAVVPNIDMRAIELVHRLSQVDATAGTLTLTSDYEIASVVLTLNGSAAGTITTITPYQYSLSGLYVSSEGLTEETVCLSLSDLIEALARLYPLVIEDEQSGIVIDSYESLIPVTGTGSAIEGRPVSRSIYQDWLKARLQVGWQFEAQNILETFAAWDWIATPEVPPLPFLSYNPTATGNASFSGLVYLENSGLTSQVAALEILVDGVIVASQGVNSLAPGFSVAFDVASMFTTSTNSFCLSPATPVQVQIATGSGADIIEGSGHTFALQFGTPCFPSPFIRDWQQYTSTPYNALKAFEDCGGILDRAITGKFEGGMGTAIAQQIGGFADYGENHFFVLSEDGANASRFERQLFFANQAGVCTCDQDRVVSWYWYNMLLQVPHILANLMQVCPSAVGVVAYDFASEVSKGGVYTATVTEKTTEQLDGIHSRVNKLELTKVFSIEDWAQRTGENVIPVTFCNETVTGVIRGLSMSLNTGEAEIELEG